MAEFIVTTPDGRSFKVEAVDINAAQNAVRTMQTGQWAPNPSDAQFPAAQPPTDPSGMPALAQAGQSFGRDLGQWGAAGYGGAVDTATFGLDDEISGLIRGLLGPNSVQGAVAESRAFKDTQRQQQPEMFTAGQVAGALPTVLLPQANLARGAGFGSRAVNAGVTNAIAGGAYGAGSADGGNMGASAGIGALGGLLTGPVGPALGATARGVGSVLRRGPVGAINRAVETSAASRVSNALGRDTGAAQPLRRAADDVEAARAAGFPAMLADVGGVATNRLTRAASNLSEDSHRILNAEVQGRFNTQADRLTDQFSSILGTSARGDTAAVAEQLQRQAALVNRPAYEAAYSSPAAQAVWTPELAQLTRSPTFQDAMRQVTRTALDDAALTGQPAVRNPFSQAADGSLTLQGGAIPNLEFWDHVHRNLSSEISSLRRSGANPQRLRDATRLHDALMTELDAIVPEFQIARQGASVFFGAQDALEAGTRMASDLRMQNDEFGRAFSSLSDPEQALFREGYSAELMDRLARTPDSNNAVRNNLLNNPKSRERMAIVFGQQAADEIEGVVRFENLMNLSKEAVQGGSPTVRNAIDAMRAQVASPAGAAAAAATTAALAMGGLSWQALIPAAIAWGARRGFVKLNEEVAQEMGRLLASSDPDAIRQAAALAARTPGANIALRNAELALSRGLGAAGFQEVEESPTWSPLLGARPDPNQAMIQALTAGQQQAGPSPAALSNALMGR